MADLASEIEAFRDRYPCDNDAFNYLVNSSTEVQQEVLAEFKPKSEGESDYSALVIGFTKRKRQNYQTPAKVEQSDAGYRRKEGPSEHDVEAFRDRYPFDEDAFNYILSSAAHVQHEILRTFKPQRDGEADYSALVISFAKRCRNAAPRSSDRVGPSDPEHADFRHRYPFDEDTHNYLQSSPPNVQKYVIQNFKPPRQGEADYSALLITYCKKCRQNPPAERMSSAMGKGQRSFDRGGYGGHDQGGYGGGHDRGGYGRGYDQGRDSYDRGGYDGGYSKGGYGRPSDGHWADAGKGKGRSYSNGHGDFGRGGSYSAGQDRALLGFRDRFPMDDRAYEYLRASAPDVQREVLDTFAPPREDSDYSALIIGFSKRCRARFEGGGMAPPKRQRVDYR